MEDISFYLSLKISEILSQIYSSLLFLFYKLLFVILDDIATPGFFFTLFYSSLVFEFFEEVDSFLYDCISINLNLKY
jgi:hypothetical protein